MSLEQRLENQEYKNWIKAGICLNIAKEGLVQFVEDECVALHQHIVKRVKEVTRTKSVVSCDDCEPSDIKFKFERKTKSYKWTIDCSICDTFLEEILSQHVLPESRQICWKNSWVSEWRNNYWDVAKCFMNPGKESSQSPADCDLSAILSLFINCLWFGYRIKDITNCDELRVKRNDFVHSGNMTLSPQDFDRLVECLVNLLEDKTNLVYLQDAQRAVGRIKQVVESNFQIRLDDERNAILQKTDQLSKDMQSLKVETESIRSQLCEDKADATKQLRLELAKVREDIKACNEDEMKSVADRLTRLERTFHENDLRALKQTLMQDYRDKYSSIAISPLLEHHKLPLQFIYTEVMVVEEQKPEMEWKIVTGLEQTEERRTKSYQEILGEDQSNIKFVYVLGEAGNGKTAWCQQMVSTWVKAHEKLEKGLDYESPDERTMAAFEYLIFVPLRLCVNAKTYFEGICQLYAEYEDAVTNMEYVFKTCPEKVLLLCDGLDEINGVPRRDKLNGCPTVITSRPWKFDTVKTSNTSVIQKVVRIKGLDENGVAKLCTRILQKCYENETIDKTKDAFLKDADIAGLRGSLQTPLILVYFMHLWYKSKTLSPSITENILGIIECLLERGDKKMEQKVKMQEYAVDETRFKSLRLPKKNIFLKYSKLLLCLAKLAFDAFTAASKDRSLVFSADEVLLYFSDDSETALTISLQLGLLSKSEISDFLRSQYVLSFPHKLFQEFFYALGAVSDETVFDNIHFSSLENVLEFSDIFAFICGLDAEKGAMLSKKIHIVCDSSHAVMNSRSDMDVETNFVNQVTETLIAGQIEVLVTNPSTKHYLVLSDFDIWVRQPLVKDQNASDIYWKAVATLARANVNETTMLKFQSDSKAQSEAFYAFITTFTATTKLQRLDIHDPWLAEGNVSNMLNPIISSNKKLTVLKLFFEDFRLSGLRLPELTELVHIELGDLPVPGLLLQDLSVIISCGKLKSLQLWFVRVNEPPIDLSQVNHLVFLGLYSIKMEEERWLKLLSTLHNLQCLRYLRITYPTTFVQGSTVEYVERINWSFLSQLEELIIKHSSKRRGFALNPIIHNLRKCRNIKDLSVSLPSSQPSYQQENVQQIQSLLIALQQMERLEGLRLSMIEFRTMTPDLSENRSLRALDVSNISMSDGAWDCFFHAIQSLPSLCYFYISDVNFDLEGVPCLPSLCVIQRKRSKTGVLRSLLFKNEKIDYHSSAFQAPHE